MCFYWFTGKLIAIWKMVVQLVCLRFCLIQISTQHSHIVLLSRDCNVITCLQTLWIDGIFDCFLSCSNLCFFCQVFASCHDDAAPASGPDAHCISARSWICAYSRYVFSPWRLWTFQMKGVAKINTKLLLFFQNVKEAINSSSLATFPII